ncbi:ras-related protein yptc6-like [Dermatophagoides farinae]|uniref:Ras-related protein yptc6-like n=1 Tax=Dermatophagoides farinae TaxID=6954 RepID=A0A9D4NVQ3_DERFA|nr:ras-related protein yptc6-like [Dermatophagoides farinae]
MNNDNNNNVNVSRKRFTQLKNPDRIIRKSANTKINETSSRSYGTNGNNCQEKDLIKIVVIGESGSGKSNLIQRLVNDRFDERSPSTIGIDFALFEFESNSLYDSKQNQTYHAQIWDTAGMERYRSSITKIFYRDVNGALLVFDLTRRDHFQALPRWLQEIRKTSAKNSTNVREAFQQLFGNILEQKQLHYYRQQQKQQQQQQNAAKNSRSKYSTKSKSQQQKSLIHQSSIRLTRDPNYLEQRARNKEKKKSGCSC